MIYSLSEKYRGKRRKSSLTCKYLIVYYCLIKNSGQFNASVGSQQSQSNAKFDQ
jgi:hypothetical protein